MIYSQPVNIHTPNPCTDTETNPWLGPKWDTVCSNHYYPLQCTDCDNCCYIIKYYDRESTPSSGGHKDYQTNVVAIFYYGGDCELRDKNVVLGVFYDKLFKSKPYQYIGKLYEPDNANGELGMYQYTTGACYQKDANGDIIFDFNGGN